MQKIDGAARVKLAHLQPKAGWDRTGRVHLIGDEVRISYIPIQLTSLVRRCSGPRMK